jgi:hypothetical protein
MPEGLWQSPCQSMATGVPPTCYAQSRAAASLDSQPCPQQHTDTRRVTHGLCHLACRAWMGV